jgi:hypothetical protein
VALAAAHAFALGRDARVRAWLPLGTAAAALLGAVSLGGAVWLLPLAVWLLVERRPLPHPSSRCGRGNRGATLVGSASLPGVWTGLVKRSRPGFRAEGDRS